jgi:integrase
MTNQIFTYLYQYKNSSNYYFRINLNFFQKFGYHHKSGHFVGSLKTSHYQDARWLALYVKTKIEKEFDMHAVVTQKGSIAQRHEVKSKVNSNVGSNMSDDIECRIALQKKLREKFNKLLIIGQQMLDAGFGEKQIVKLSQDEIHQAFSQPANVPIDEGSTRSETLQSWLPTSLDVNHVLMFSQVMTELSKRINSYEYSAESTSSLEFKDGADFITALAQQQMVKEHVTQIQKEENKTYSLTNQFELFIQEKTKQVDYKTIEGYHKKFEFLFSVIDKSLDVRLFDKQHMQKVKSLLLDSYANARKGCTANKMSVKTINTYLSNYRTFFTWLGDHVNEIKDNPFAGVSVSEKRGKKIKRRSFTSSEILKQLCYKFCHGSEARKFRGDATWFVPVGIYTGMRLNEIAALSLKNVVKIQGIWSFDLTGVKVKNEPSDRIVPIAQYLLDSGILEYIETVKSRGETLLFPEIRRGKDKPGKAGWGDPISRWFNRTALKNLGIDIDEEERRGTAVCFHSIRHTFIAKLTNASCQGYLIKRIVGHSVDDDVTFGDYGGIDKIPLRILKEEMDKHLSWHLEDQSIADVDNDWTITTNAELCVMGSNC